MDLRGRETELVSDRTRRLLAWLLLLIGAGLAALFLQRFLLVELHVRRLAFPILLACASAVAAASTGGALRRFAGGSAHPKVVSDFLVGYPVYGTFCFLAGLVSTGVVLQSIVLFAGIAIFPFIARDYRGAAQPAPPAERSALAIVSVAMLAIALTGGLLSAQLPPSTLDELAYHLAVPQAWVAAGQSIELPILSHSYFPLGIESADVPLLALLGRNGAIASHFLHWIAALASTLLLVTTFRGWCGPALALAFSAAIITTPALLVTAGWSWNEWPLAGICIVLVAAMRSTERDAYAPLAILAGLLTKYTFYPIALIAFGWLWMRGERRRLLVLSACGLIFPVRNLILTGNPFAPFFASDAPHLSGFRQARGLELAASYLFDGRWIDESLGFAAITLAAGTILLRTREALFPLLVGACGVLVLMLAPSSRVLLPFIVIPAMYGAYALRGSLSDRAARRVAAAFAAAASIQLFAASYVTHSYEPWEVLSSRMTDDEFVARARSSASTAREVDASLPPESRTLVIGLQELALFQNDVVGGGNADGPRINALLESSDLRARLADLEITHVAIARQGLRDGSHPISHRDRERVTVLGISALRALAELRRTATVITENDRILLLQLR